MVRGASSFEERKAIGVEEAAAVGGERETVVVDAAVDGSEGGEQSVPGGGAAFEGVEAVAGGGLAEVVAEGEDGVRLGPKRVFSGKQSALLGEEQEDQTHEDGDGRFVDLGACDVGEDLPVAGDVISGDGSDEELNRLADRRAEALGEFGFGIG
ncbi:MAG: hypothetical protein ACLGHQ_04100, partial [Acidimicrobiia bacterium]